jgi:hypothetical protein
MLIVNDEHRVRAGVCNLDEVCPYCGFAFAEYPLILSDDAEQTVYHAACALQLATEVLVDLSVRQRHTAPCLLLHGLRLPQIEKEVAMQSTDLEEIKAELLDQASHPYTRVSWGVAQVMAVKRSRGKLLALL